MIKILLLGNPNCGKTTLFNALTGENQRIGNWSGVTVEQKTGSFTHAAQEFELVDLPGIYSLTCTPEGASPDELITAKALVNFPADLIINVVDACHLERHLYLTSQLLELGKPLVVALNMVDIAQQRGIQVDTVKLSQALHSPVVSIQAHKKIGIICLQQVLLQTSSAFTESLDKPSNLAGCLPAEVLSAHQALTQQLTASQKYPAYCAWRVLEGDSILLAAQEMSAASVFHEPELDLILANARYETIHQVVKTVQTKQSDASEHFTARLDKLVLHRYLAFPIFFAVMYLMFLFAINIGGVFQDFFDISSDALFVQGTASVLQTVHAPQWLIALLANGVGRGINTTVTFIPVIAAMFFFLALLETSGYMARAAFVVDKLMRRLGLPGKSFVPMIVGFGCNVPAIMAARTLDSPRDRILTVIMAPFMSCSARLAIYAVFVAAFFPTGGQNIVFSLYLIGILMAVFTGFLLRKTVLKGQAAALILELPAYHKPSLVRLLRETGRRLRQFIKRAGRIIIPACVFLGGLNAFNLDGSLNFNDANMHSVLSQLGRSLTPWFAPMGIQMENWPATVGLLTGILAKEVVIGTLNSLYVPIGDLTSVAASDLRTSLLDACWSIPHNLAQLKDALLNPIVASAPDSEVSRSMYGVMVSRFDGKAGAFAYLLFVLLYIPCVSTMAAIRQETTRTWMWFSTGWSLVLAYVVAVLFYQVATFAQHPSQSLAWITALGLLFLLSFQLLTRHYLGRGGTYVTANS